MNAMVHHNACAGCGSCAEMCPNVFFMKRGKAAVGVAEIPPDLLFSCYLTAQRCPNQAIALGAAQALIPTGSPNERPAWIAV